MPQDFNNTNNINDNENTHESFEQLLEGYYLDKKTNLQIGDKITGKIVSIGMDTVFIDTGTKIDGSVEKKELLDENGQFLYKTGDTLDLYIVSLKEEEIILSKAISDKGKNELLYGAFKKKVPVSGKVKEQCKGGFIIDLLDKKAFCPISQLDCLFIKNPEEYVSKTFNFLITSFKDKGRNIVVSRRALLEIELEKEKNTFLETVSTGQVITGKVSKIMPYGAFVHLFPGIEGMIHISEISWSKKIDINDYLKIGDTVEVMITSIENEDKLKISLSIKQLSDDPWNDNISKLKPGDKVKGKVTNCMKFGAFVEIMPSIEGLVHISEMSYVKRILNPEDVVKVGDTVDVMIKEIDTEKRKISLSIRDAEGDPWIDVEKKFNIGKSINGVIEKKEKFGYFVSLSPGIDGLLPVSNIKKISKPSDVEKLKTGDQITVIIDSINKEDKKISLSVNDTSDEGEWKKFAKKSKSEPLSDFGHKLNKFLKKA